MLVLFRMAAEMSLLAREAISIRTMKHTEHRKVKMTVVMAAHPECHAMTRSSFPPLSAGTFLVMAAYGGAPGFIALGALAPELTTSVG